MTDRHPDFIGNGSLAAVFSQAMKRTSTSNTEYCLGISFNQETIPGGTPAVQATNGTVQVTGSGSANTATIVLRVENKDGSGTAGSDVTFTITVAAAKVGWSAGAASAYTIKDVIDLINEDDAGGTNGKFLQCFKAWIKDARYDLPVNAAGMFASEAEKAILPPGGTAGYTYFLTRDLDVDTVDSDLVRYMRIGLPEARDRGLFKCIDMFGTITGTTNGTIKVYRDDIEDFVAPTGTYATDMANHDLLFQLAAASLSANAGTTAGMPLDLERAAVWRGPVVVEVKSDDVTNVDMRVLLQAV